MQQNHYPVHTAVPEGYTRRKFLRDAAIFAAGSAVGIFAPQKLTQTNGKSIEREGTAKPEKPENNDKIIEDLETKVAEYIVWNGSGRLDGSFTKYISIGQSEHGAGHSFRMGAKRNYQTQEPYITHLTGAVRYDKEGDTTEYYFDNRTDSKHFFWNPNNVVHSWLYIGSYKSGRQSDLKLRFEVGKSDRKNIEELKKAYIDILSRVIGFHSSRTSSR